MAEMTVAEAVATLHNNQYQKHIGNGEYDYIHPLTDTECKGIESLIKSQQQTIESLKCCGNCRNWNQHYSECSMDINWGTLHTDRDDKCKKWEGVSRED